MLYQSYRQVFVTNSPALLAEGQTVDNLAVGQIGVLDGKTHLAVSNPTYAKNKALKVVWGTPDNNLGDFGGVPNENEYSKLIKGKKIKRIRANKAQRGQTPLYTVGWSGDSTDTNTLFAKTGERKVLFVKLTGTIIDRLYSKQGLTKQFVFEPDCVSDCETDLCADIDPRLISKQLVEKINADLDFKKFIKVKELVSCENAVPPVTTTCYKFILNVCDTGDDMSLGLVQAQYPSDKVTRIDRNAAISSYEIVRFANTLPTAYSSSNSFVPDCPECPAGGTLVEGLYIYTVEVNEGDVIDVHDPEAEPADGLPIIAITELHTEGGRTTYTVYSETELEASDLPEGADFNLIGEGRNICQLPATTIVWVANGTLLRQSRAFRLTIADTICGTNRLTDIQAAYPNLVVTIVNGEDTGCVHTYETTVQSDCYEDGCAIDQIVFTAPDPFEGAIWDEVVPALSDDTCLTGIQFETAFFHRITNDCTFDYFPYENDLVYIQISNYNPDFNASPCEGEWEVKQIRQAKFPEGHGDYVRRLEQKSKAYDRRHRSLDPVVREVQGYSLQADPNKFYDEYVIEYDFEWMCAGGWGEKYREAHSLFLYVPEGQGAQLETILNSYATSAGVDEDGAAI